MAVRILLLSDLHLEDVDHGSWVPAEGHDFDVLACAGDVVASDPGACVDVVARIARGRPAVLVLGNHDVWDRSLREALETARARNPAVHVLEGGDPVTILGLTFAGGTLWDDPDDWPPGIPRLGGPDGTQSGEPVFVERAGAKARATLSDLAVIHRSTVEAIAAARPDVVLTHYPPSEADLARMDRPVVWLHGHIHASANEMRGPHRLVRVPFMRHINLFGGLVAMGHTPALHAVSLVLGTGRFGAAPYRSIFEDS